MLAQEERIQNKKQLKEWLDYELKFYPCDFLRRFFRIGENALLYKHQVLLRKSEYYQNSGKKIAKIIAKYRLLKIQNRYALHIAPNCCAKGLRIMHLGPILMNNRVTVGENCTLHMNTALVAGGTNDDVPTLGRNVIVGYGACVLGGVTVADYVAIGANAVVNKDCLEPHVAIAGVPAKKISNNGTREWNKKANLQAET